MDSTGASILAGLIGFFAVFSIFILAFVVVILAAQFKIFKKAGEEGWKCLIPFYNTYVQCQFIGINPNWVWIILGLAVLSAVPLVSLVSGIASIYFNVLQSVSLARSFGKSDGYAIGLILLPVVFIPMLGFGNAEYVGPRPMNDFIFKNYNPTNPTTGTNNTQNPQAQQPVQNTGMQNPAVNTGMQNPAVNTGMQNSAATTPAFCQNCGNKLEDGSSFCTSCGTKIN